MLEQYCRCQKVRLRVSVNSFQKHEHLTAHDPLTHLPPHLECVMYFSSMHVRFPLQVCRVYSVGGRCKRNSENAARPRKERRCADSCNEVVTYCTIT